jgi:hypothetical protein
VLCIRRIVIHSHFPEASAKLFRNSRAHHEAHERTPRPNPDFQTMVHAPGTLERPAHVRVRAASEEREDCSYH